VRTCETSVYWTRLHGAMFHKALSSSFLSHKFLVNFFCTMQLVSQLCLMKCASKYKNLLVLPFSLTYEGEYENLCQIRTFDNHVSSITNWIICLLHLKHTPWSWQFSLSFTIPLTSVSRPALGPTQPPVQWVPGVLSPGVKHRPGRDVDHSPHLVPKSRMSRSCISSPP
jgi:hypothetical protein